MNRATKLSSMAVIGLLVCFAVSPVFAGGTWSTLRVIPDGRATSSGAVINGKLYVVSGWNGYAYSLTNTTYMYDPLTNLWASKAAVPTASMFAGAAVVNGKLYVIGGANANYYYDWRSNSYLTSGPSRVVQMYDPVTDTWTTMANMITARLAPAVGAIDGKIYVAGGADPSGVAINSVEVYDPTTNTWSIVAASPMPTARYYAAYGVMNGKLYVAGGYASDHTSDAMEVYDPYLPGNGWTQETAMPNPRLQPASGVINGSLYVGGGWDMNTGTFLADLEIYDSATKTWTTNSPNMRVWRAQSVGGSINGNFYVVGGVMNNGVVQLDNEVFSPTTCP